MDRPPLNEKSPKLSCQTLSSRPTVQRDSNRDQILGAAEEAINLAKSIATCRARLAIAGAAVLHELPGGSLRVSCGGMTRHIQDLDGLHALLRQVEGRTS